MSTPASNAMLYHVTERTNLPGIYREGLVPQAGPRAHDSGEAGLAVFCFPSKDACEDGLSGWLGECFWELPTGALVVIELDYEPVRSTVDAGFEVAVHEVIPPAAIRRVLDEDLKSEVPGWRTRAAKAGKRPGPKVRA